MFRNAAKQCPTSPKESLYTARFLPPQIGAVLALTRTGEFFVWHGLLAKTFDVKQASGRNSSDGKKPKVI